jgi:hypothetical protein
LEFQRDQAETQLVINNLDADNGWESPQQRTQMIEQRKAELEGKRQKLDKTFSLFKPEVAKEMEPTWKALDRYASDSGYFGGESGLKGAATLAGDVATFGAFSEKAAEDKIQYEKLRDTVSKDFNLTPEEVDDVMRHRLNKFDGDVSRDAFGTLHFKDSALVKNTDEIEDIISKSKLPESVKATAKEEAPQRVALFKENVVQTAKQNFPELAKELGLGDDINENYRKIVDATNKSRTAQALSGAGQYALGRGETIMKASATTGGMAPGLGGMTYVAPPKLTDAEKAEFEQFIATPRKVSEGITALSDKIQQDKVRIFGTDAAVVGQGGASVLESIGLVAVTGGAGNLIKAERIARAGAAGKLILGGVKAGLTVAPTGAIYGGEAALETWERASQSDDPAIRERAGELATKTFFAEFGITTGMSAIGLGGAEKIGAALASKATREVFAKSVSGAFGKVAMNFGVAPVSEAFEESLITALQSIHVEQQLNPDMTDEQVRSSIKDTIVSTLIATGGISGPKGTIDFVRDIRNISTQDKTTEELHELSDAEYKRRATEENLPETETAGRAFPTSGPVSLAEIERERAAQIELTEDPEEKKTLAEATPEELAGEWGVDLTEKSEDKKESQELSEVESRQRAVAGISQLDEDTRELLAIRLEALFEKNGSLKWDDVPVEIKNKIGTGEAAALIDRLKNNPKHVIDALNVPSKSNTPPTTKESQEPGAATTEGVSGEAESPVAPASETVGKAEEDAAYAEANAWDMENRGKRSDEWFEGGKANMDAINGYRDSLAAGGSQLQAHGMAKEATLSGAIRNLSNLLRNGLDPNRRGGRLDTAALVSGDANASGGATAGGAAYSDGPFTLIAKPGGKAGQDLSGDLSNLGAVVINQANAAQAESIKKAILAIRPDLIVGTTSELGAITEQLLGKKATTPIAPTTTPVATTPAQPSAQKAPAAPQSEQKDAQTKPIKLSGFKGSTQSTNRDLIIESLGESTETGVVETDSGVKVEMQPFEDGVELRAIQNLGGTKGAASETLDRITEEADALGTKLYLYPKPFGTGERMSKAQLVAWYQKRGFVMSKNGETMVRTPKATKPAQQPKAEEVKTDKKEDTAIDTEADVASEETVRAVNDAMLEALGLTAEEAQEITGEDLGKPEPVSEENPTGPKMDKNGQLELFQEPEPEAPENPAVGRFLRDNTEPDESTSGLLEDAGEVLFNDTRQSNLSRTGQRVAKLADNLIQNNINKSGNVAVGLVNMYGFLAKVWSMKNRRTPGWPSFLTPKQVANRASILAHEIVSSIAKKGSGVDWYRGKIDEMYVTLSRFYPELREAGQDRFIFSTILAITSNGENVFNNMNLAVKLYDIVRGQGRMPNESDATGIAAREKAMFKGFATVQRLIEKDGWATVDADFKTETPYGAMKKKYGVAKNDEAADVEVSNAYVLGAKIGAFWGNLNGNFKHIAMDLWFTRTMSRIAGDFSTIDPAKLKKYAKILAAADDVPSEVRDELQMFLNDIPQEGANWTSVPVEIRDKMPLAYAWIKQSFNRYASRKDPETGKTYYQGSYTEIQSKYFITALDKNTNAPKNADHRQWMRDVLNEAQRQLKEAGIDLSLAEIQAVMWFHEKDLYTKFGATSKMGERADYAQAAENSMAGRTQFRGDAGPRAEDVPQDLFGREVDAKASREAKKKLIAGRAEQFKEIRGKKGVTTLNQDKDPKGQVTFRGLSEAFITYMKSADGSTAVHEPIHVARRFLLNKNVPADKRLGITDEMIDAANEFVGSTDSNWTVAQEEKFARAFERYLWEGAETGNAKVDTVFGKIRDLLRKVYSAIEGSSLDVELTPEIKKLFGQLITRGETLKKQGAKPTAIPLKVTVEGKTAKPKAEAKPQAAPAPKRKIPARKMPAVLPFGVKREDLDAARRRYGIPERQGMVVRMTDEESLDEAYARLAKNDKGDESVLVGQKLVLNLMEGKRGSDKVEVALLAIHGFEIQKALKDLETKIGKLDPAETQKRKSYETLQEALLNDFQDLVNITQLQGSRAGLALQAMKLVANEVYSVDAMLRRRAIWKNTGKKPGQAKEPLTPAEMRDTEAQSKKILELIKERERLMKELEDKYNREEAAAIITKKEKDVAKEKKPAKPRGVLAEKAVAVATSARDRLRSMGLGITRLNQMAGERAQMPQFRRDSLDTAKAMAAQGKTAEEIRAVTGWFPGRYDGKMRWEIPDSGAKLTAKWENLPAFTGLFGKPEYILLKDALDHPELFAAYPQLGDVWLSKQGQIFDFFGAVQGWFNPDTNSLNVTPNAKDPLSTLLHETQHWIQQREGFARGSNTEAVMKGLSPSQKTAAVAKMQEKAAELIAAAERKLVASEEALGLADNLNESAFDEAASVFEKADSAFSVAFREFGTGTPEVRGAYDALDAAKKEKWMAAGLDPSPSKVVSNFDLYWAVQNAKSKSELKSKAEADRSEAREAILNQNELLLNAGKSEEGFEAAVKAFDLGYQLYQNVAGEIESRDVQARANMTPEQLAATAPYSSENIAEDDAIVLFQEGEAQAVASPPSREVSPALAAKLEAGEKIRLFRAMQIIDGKLYPPMSALVEGKLRPPTEIGVWEQAEERPDLINKKGKFVLNKGNKATVPAAYNPYFHTSFSPLNDQFSSAYKRDNLVTVEVEVPASEQTSGYKAEGAKNAVGMAPWNVGPVSGKLPVGKKRQVMLSRYAKVVRVVPDSEVAGNIAKLLEGTELSIPENVVTPSLKIELENQGVTVTPLDKRFKSETTTLRQDEEPSQVEILDALSDVGTEYLTSNAKTLEAFTEKLVSEFGEEFRDQTETIFGLAKDKLAKLASTARQKTPQELASLIDPTKDLSQKMVYNMALGFMRPPNNLKGDAVLDAVTELLRNDYPDVTREEVVIAFTGYGKILIPSQEQIKKDIRELRTIERLNAQLDDLAKGELPKRTGLQRDKTTPTVRALMKQVEAAIRDSGLQQNDKKARLAGSLDPIKTRLKNEIADMDQAIKTKTALNKAKKEPKTDAEIEKLKKQRDDMKKRYDATFGIDRKKISVEAQIKRASSILDRQIKALEAEARGEILNNPKKVKLDSPELKAKRERLESLREAKRAATEALNPKKTAAEIATNRLYDSVSKSIERFEYFIRNGTYPPTAKGVAPTLNSVLKDMMATRDRLRDTVREIQKDRRILTPPEVIARRRAITQLNKTIADLEARIAKRDFSKRAKKPESTDPAVRNLKATVANLRKTLDQLKNDSLKPISPEEKRIQRMIAASKKRRENYERRLAAGDFAKTVKRDTKEDSRLTAVKIEEMKAKAAWMEEGRKYALANMSATKRFWHGVKSLLMIRKLVALGSEFGIAFRQLLFFSYRFWINPKIVTRAFVKSFAATFNRDKEIQYYNEIIDRPNSVYDKRMKMSYVSPFADLERLQEMDAVDPDVLEKISSKIPKWIPLRWATEFMLSVERFNRVSINVARAYLADTLIDKGVRDPGNPSSDELAVIGNAVLAATGRGSLGDGKLDAGLALLNTVTISARYAVSRAQMTALQPLWTTAGKWEGTGRVRAHIAADIYGKSIVGRVIAGYVIAGIVRGLTPDDEEEDVVWNPTSSKLGVIYYKGTAIELNGGARAYVNLLAQAVMGYKLNGKGEVVPLRGEGSIGFGKRSWRDELYGFVRNRENINMAMIIDTIEQQHFGDIPMTKTSFTRQLLEPIIVDDLVNIFETHGIAEGSVLATAMFFGVGVRTPWEKTEKKEPEYNWIRF